MQIAKFCWNLVRACLVRRGCGMVKSYLQSNSRWRRLCDVAQFDVSLSSGGASL